MLLQSPNVAAADACNLKNPQSHDNDEETGDRSNDIDQ